MAGINKRERGSDPGIQLRGTKENPYHLSYGIIMWNPEYDGTIALIRKPDGILTLPRETPFSNESVEDVIARGSGEEIGVSGTGFRRYRGSL